MKIKQLEEDIICDVAKPIYRKWWQIWKPKVVGTCVSKVVHKKGDKYIDAEGQSVSEVYDEIRIAYNI
jgi:hypothetical protein